MPEDFATYLAFDFGLKRIGIAVGQSITGTATPLSFLHAEQGIPSWPLIQQLINEWAPAKLIIGLPLNMDGTEQAITKKARAFAKELTAKFSISIELVDERLTTIEARSRMFEQGGYKALKKGQVDSVAATIMLEDWMLLQG